MQAVKGHISNGVFTPLDNFNMPSYAQVILIIEEVFAKVNQPDTLLSPSVDNEALTSIAWLDKVEALLKQSRDEDISDFPTQETIKNLNDYPWFE
ncbi:MAG: hypothetical protein FWC73_04305 [Defluviitaleaceae bacterium]|nr:hypothetical protein [Defluviitaleaceae bacterium]